MRYCYFFHFSEADSCCLNAVIFTSQNELFTGNSRGMMKLWDLRATGGKPTLTTTLSEDSEVKRKYFINYG